jgi:hypothetical protein
MKPLRWRGASALVLSAAAGIFVTAALIVALHSRDLPEPKQPQTRDDVIVAIPLRAPLRRSLEGRANEQAHQQDVTCRNLATGPARVVDDRGHVCHVTLVMRGGCCPGPDHRDSVNETCRFVENAPADVDPFDAAEFGSVCSVELRCCSDLSLCIACCMAGAAPLVESSRASFPDCTGLCRHNSRSTYHQNQYATPLHHCYGSA